MCKLRCVRLFATPWTVAHQVPMSMGLFRQECWSGLPFHSPGDLLNRGIKPISEYSSPVSTILAGRFFTTAPLGKPHLEEGRKQKRLTSVLYEQLNRQANKHSFCGKEMRGQCMDFSNMCSPSFSLARIDERQMES